MSVNQTYRNILQESVISFAIKMLIKILLHAIFISLKFSVILLVIVLPCNCKLTFYKLIKQLPLQLSLLFIWKVSIATVPEKESLSATSVQIWYLRFLHCFGSTILPNRYNLALTKKLLILRGLLNEIIVAGENTVLANTVQREIVCNNLWNSFKPLRLFFLS